MNYESGQRFIRTGKRNALTEKGENFAQVLFILRDYYVGKLIPYKFKIPSW